jgi:hypothetical protein
MWFKVGLTQISSHYEFLGPPRPKKTHKRTLHKPSINSLV